MLYILSGQDDYSLGRSLEEIKKEISDPSALTSSITTLDGQHVTLDQLRIECETMPFLGGRRLVIIKGLLERFESGGGPGRQRKTKTTRASPPEEYKSFGACISRIPDSTVLVLIENKAANHSPLFKEIADKAVVKSFPLLKDRELQQWVQKRVGEEGGSISLQAAGLLTRLVGSNLWAMAGEISKLVLFTSGRRIEEKDIKAIVGYVQQANVFGMVDAIIEFKSEMAEQLLQQLLQSGSPPAYLLVMLSRQFRMIVLASELKRQRKTQIQIQEKLGLISGYALRKTLEQARRYSMPRLKKVYSQLLETDLAIKTGRYDAELALNILVAELSQRGQSDNTTSDFPSN